MDSYLESLRGDGSLVGGGQFTLDAERGLFMLSHARVKEPLHSVLYALSSAMLAQAPRVQVRLLTPWRISITDEAAGLSQEDADELFTHLLSRRNLRLHYLARALYTLAGQKFSSLTYTSGQQRLSWTGRGFAVTRLPKARPANCLEVRGYWWAGSGLIELILRRARFFAGRLVLGRRKVGSPVIIPAQAPAARVLTHPGFQVEAKGAVPQKISPGPFSAVIWLKNVPSRMSEMVFLEGGVEYQTVQEALGYPGWEGVIEAPHLARDLNGQVVVSDSYRLFLQSLQEQAWEMLEAVPDPDRLRPPWLGGIFAPREMTNPWAATPYTPGLGLPEIAADGRFCLTWAADHLQVWDLRSGLGTLCLPALPKAHRHGQPFRLCAGTSIVAVLCAESRRWIDGFDCRTGQPVASYLHPEIITSFAFSPDGMTMFVCGSSGGVYAVDTASGARRQIFSSPNPQPELDEGHSILLSPDGQRLAIQTSIGLFLHDIFGQKSRLLGRSRACEWCEDGSRLLTWGLFGYEVIGCDGNACGPPLVPSLVRSDLSFGEGEGCLTLWSGALGQRGRYVLDSQWLEGEPSESVPSAYAALFADGLGDRQLDVLTRRRWLVVRSLSQQLEIVEMASVTSKAIVGQPLAAGRAWRAGALSQGLACGHEGGLWIWDFSTSAESFRRLPGHGCLQMLGDYVVSGHSLLDRSGESLWQDERIYLLDQGLALCSTSPQDLRVVSAATGHTLHQLPPEGEWRWLHGSLCTRQQIQGELEVWDCQQGRLLSTFRSALSSWDGLTLAFIPQLLAGEGRPLLALHPARWWSVVVRLSHEGFHVLACYHRESKQAEWALRLEGSFSRDCRLAFSSSGASLALQIGSELHLFAFDGLSGQPDAVGRRPLSTATWCWAGEALLLVDSAFVEICNGQGEGRLRLYLSEAGYSCLLPGSSQILEKNGPLKTVWEELQIPPQAPAVASQESQVALQDGPLLGGLQPPVPLDRSVWPALDCCPGCEEWELSGDGRFAVTLSSDHLQVWDWPGQRVLWAVPRVESGRWRLCPQFSCLALIAGDSSQYLTFVDLASGQERATYRHLKSIATFAFDSSHNRLLLVDPQLALSRVHLGTGVAEFLAEEPRRDQAITCHLSPDGRGLAVQGRWGVHLFMVAGGFYFSESLDGEFIQWSGDSSSFLFLCEHRVMRFSLANTSLSKLAEGSLLWNDWQLSQRGDWLLYRGFDPESGLYACHALRWSASVQVVADRFAYGQRKLAWTVGNQLRLGEFPVLRCDSQVSLKTDSRKLRFSPQGNWLATLSQEDQLECWQLPKLQPAAALGRPLARGRRAQLVATPYGLALRTSSELCIWDLQGPEPSLWRQPHGGLALARLQSHSGLLAHSHRPAGCQVLSGRGQPLWEAQEVCLLSEEQALMRDHDGLVWEINPHTGQRRLQINDWHGDWPLDSLPSSLLAGSRSRHNFRAEGNPWGHCPANQPLPLTLKTPYGEVVEGKDGVIYSLAGPDELPVSRHYTWDDRGQYLISVYPQGSECRLQSYDLGTGQVQSSPEVIEFLPVGGPRLNQDGSRVALQIGRQIRLYRFSEGSLQWLPTKVAIPEGCGWGWVGNSLALWRANWIEFLDSNGGPLLRLYLLKEGYQVASPHSQPAEPGQLGRFWQDWVSPGRTVP